jgi:DNA-binding protein HU-beta
MPMTKTQVVAYLAEEVGITKKQGAAALDALAALAAKIIKKGEKLALPGFVTVKVQHRKARVGRNPQTGEPLKIPAKKVVKAVPAAALKAILATKKR